MIVVVGGIGILRGGREGMSFSAKSKPHNTHSRIVIFLFLFLHSFTSSQLRGSRLARWKLYHWIGGVEGGGKGVWRGDGEGMYVEGGGVWNGREFFLPENPNP